MTVFEKNGRWNFRFQIKGREYWRAVPEATSKREAEKAEAAFKGDLLHGKYDLAENKKYKSLYNLIEEYLKYSKVNKISYENDLIYTNHLKNILGNTDINEITPQLIETYKEKRLELVSKATVNRELNSISKMFSIAVENKWLNENPCFKVKKLRVENKLERFLTIEEEARLLDHCTGNQAYLKPIIICALHTGMRKAEILNLKWSCVNFIHGYIDVLKTKSGKARKIPLTKTLAKELNQLARITEYVFTNPETNKTYYDLKKPFNRLCDKAGISNLRFHDLRHTAATRMVSAGIDLVVVQELLGHHDIKTTMRYSHPVPERKKLAIEALDNFCKDVDNVVPLTN